MFNSPALWIHATGVLALALNLHGLVRSCDRSLRRTSAWASLLWTANNLLLGAHTAAALSAISAGRQVSASALQARDERMRRWACMLFLALTAVTGAMTWQGWVSLFTSAGSMLATYAMFCLQGAALRVALLLVAVLWMANAWAYSSWEQAVANLATAAAAGVGAWRLQRDT